MWTHVFTPGVERLNTMTLAQDLQLSYNSFAQLPQTFDDDELSSDFVVGG